MMHGKPIHPTESMNDIMEGNYLRKSMENRIIRREWVKNKNEKAMGSEYPNPSTYIIERNKRNLNHHSSNHMI